MGLEECAILVRAGPDTGCKAALCIWNVHICMGRFSGIFTPKLGTTKLHFQTSNSFIAEKCEQEWEEKNVVLGMSRHGVVQCSLFRLVSCFGFI